MVFRIRDKNVFWTRSGWKNNYTTRVLNMPRRTSPTETLSISTRRDHHSFLRMVQSYRNYSRICKQYTYGDKTLQHAIQMELRVAFRIPFECSTPVQLIKYGADRRFADQLDRDNQLLSYNYHPFQVYAYQLQNKRLREQNQDAELLEKNEQTKSQAIEAAFQAELALQSSKIPKGDKLSLEKLTEVYNRISNATREHFGETKLTRGQDGQYKDYLERRRPLTEANDIGYSH